MTISKSKEKLTSTISGKIHFGENGFYIDYIISIETDDCKLLDFQVVAMEKKAASNSVFMTHMILLTSFLLTFLGKFWENFETTVISHSYPR